MNYGEGEARLMVAPYGSASWSRIKGLGLKSKLRSSDQGWLSATGSYALTEPTPARFVFGHCRGNVPWVRYKTEQLGCALYFPVIKNIERWAPRKNPQADTYCINVGARAFHLPFV